MLPYNTTSHPLEENFGCDDTFWAELWTDDDLPHVQRLCICIDGAAGGVFLCTWNIGPLLLFRPLQVKNHYI